MDAGGRATHGAVAEGRNDRGNPPTLSYTLSLRGSETTAAISQRCRNLGFHKQNMIPQDATHN